MSEDAPGSWFYTRQGEQKGPATFAELQAIARGGELHPRHDMAWTQGMSDWKPAGEIENLFEKRAEPKAAEAATPVADPYPYQAPNEREVTEVRFQDVVWPGARRRSFYAMTILFPFIWTTGYSLAIPLLQQQFGNYATGVATIVAMLLPWILAIVYGLKRLVNLGMSRWWYLGSFVPILNLWVCYRMYVCPAGYAYHKKLDGAGVVLAILYWLMILLSVLMVASFIALMAGAIGTPEMREQFEEAFRRAGQGNN